MQACKYLSDSSLEPLYKHNALPSLCELDLSYGTLCQSAIEELLAFCRHLTHVSLNGCVNMHDLDWSFPMEKLASSSMLPQEEGDRLLQSLNCVGCPNIKKVTIPPTARCVHLSLLNLSLSSNLKEVDLSCCNLFILNLRYCYLLLYHIAILLLVVAHIISLELCRVFCAAQQLQLLGNSEARLSETGQSISPGTHYQSCGKINFQMKNTN